MIQKMVLNTLQNKTMDNNEELSNLSVVDLKKECKIRGLRGYSKFKKAELINLLNGDDNEELDEQISPCVQIFS